MSSKRIGKSVVDVNKQSIVDVQKQKVLGGKQQQSTATVTTVVRPPPISSQKNDQALLDALRQVDELERSMSSKQLEELSGLLCTQQPFRSKLPERVDSSHMTSPETKRVLFGSVEQPHLWLQEMQRNGSNSLNKMLREARAVADQYAPYYTKDKKQQVSMWLNNHARKVVRKILAAADHDENAEMGVLRSLDIGALDALDELLAYIKENTRVGTVQHEEGPSLDMLKQLTRLELERREPILQRASLAYVDAHIEEQLNKTDDASLNVGVTVQDLLEQAASAKEDVWEQIRRLPGFKRNAMGQYESVSREVFSDYNFNVVTPEQFKPQTFGEFRLSDTNKFDALLENFRSMYKKTADSDPRFDQVGNAYRAEYASNMAYTDVYKQYLKEYHQKMHEFIKQMSNRFEQQYAQWEEQSTTSTERIQMMFHQFQQFMLSTDFSGQLHDWWTLLWNMIVYFCQHSRENLKKLLVSVGVNTEEGVNAVEDYALGFATACRDTLYDVAPSWSQTGTIAPILLMVLLVSGVVAYRMSTFGLWKDALLSTGTRLRNVMQKARDVITNRVTLVTTSVVAGVALGPLTLRVLILLLPFYFLFGALGGITRRAEEEIVDEDENEEAEETGETVAATVAKYATEDAKARIEESEDARRERIYNTHPAFELIRQYMKYKLDNVDAATNPQAYAQRYATLHKIVNSLDALSGDGTVRREQTQERFLLFHRYLPDGVLSAIKDDIDDVWKHMTTYGSNFEQWLKDDVNKYLSPRGINPYQGMYNVAVITLRNISMLRMQQQQVVFNFVDTDVKPLLANEEKRKDLITFMLTLRQSNDALFREASKRIAANHLSSIVESGIVRDVLADHVTFGEAADVGASIKIGAAASSGGVDQDIAQDLVTLQMATGVMTRVAPLIPLLLPVARQMNIPPQTLILQVVQSLKPEQVDELIQNLGLDTPEGVEDAKRRCAVTLQTMDEVEKNAPSLRSLQTFGSPASLMRIGAHTVWHPGHEKCLEKVDRENEQRERIENRWKLIRLLPKHLRHRAQRQLRKEQQRFYNSLTIDAAVKDLSIDAREDICWSVQRAAAFMECGVADDLLDRDEASKEFKKNWLNSTQEQRQSMLYIGAKSYNRKDDPEARDLQPSAVASVRDTRMLGPDEDPFNALVRQQIRKFIDSMRRLGSFDSYARELQLYLAHWNAYQIGTVGQLIFFLCYDAYPLDHYEQSLLRYLVGLLGQRLQQLIEWFQTVRAASALGQISLEGLREALTEHSQHLMASSSQQQQQDESTLHQVSILLHYINHGLRQIHLMHSAADDDDALILQDLELNGALQSLVLDESRLGDIGSNDDSSGAMTSRTLGSLAGEIFSIPATPMVSPIRGIRSANRPSPLRQINRNRRGSSSVSTSSNRSSISSLDGWTGLGETSMMSFDDDDNGSFIMQQIGAAVASGARKQIGAGLLFEARSQQQQQQYTVDSLDFEVLSVGTERWYRAVSIAAILGTVRNARGLKDSSIAPGSVSEALNAFYALGHTEQSVIDQVQYFLAYYHMAQQSTLMETIGVLRDGKVVGTIALYHEPSNRRMVRFGGANALGFSPEQLYSQLKIREGGRLLYGFQLLGVVHPIKDAKLFPNEQSVERLSNELYGKKAVEIVRQMQEERSPARIGTSVRNDNNSTTTTTIVEKLLLPHKYFLDYCDLMVQDEVDVTHVQHIIDLAYRSMVKHVGNNIDKYRVFLHRIYAFIRIEDLDEIKLRMVEALLAAFFVQLAHAFASRVHPHLNKDSTLQFLRTNTMLEVVRLIQHGYMDNMFKLLETSEDAVDIHDLFVNAAASKLVLRQFIELSDTDAKIHKLMELAKKFPEDREEPLYDNVDYNLLAKYVDMARKLENAKSTAIYDTQSHHTNPSMYANRVTRQEASMSVESRMMRVGAPVATLRERYLVDDDDALFQPEVYFVEYCKLVIQQGDVKEDDIEEILDLAYHSMVRFVGDKQRFKDFSNNIFETVEESEDLGRYELAETLTGMFTVHMTYLFVSRVHTALNKDARLMFLRGEWLLEFVAYVSNTRMSEMFETLEQSGEVTRWMLLVSRVASGFMARHFIELLDTDAKIYQMIGVGKGLYVNYRVLSRLLEDAKKLENAKATGIHDISVNNTAPTRSARREVSMIESRMMRVGAPVATPQAVMKMIDVGRNMIKAVPELQQIAKTAPGMVKKMLPTIANGGKEVMKHLPQIVDGLKSSQELQAAAGAARDLGKQIFTKENIQGFVNSAGQAASFLRSGNNKSNGQQLTEVMQQMAQQQQMMMQMMMQQMQQQQQQAAKPAAAVSSATAGLPMSISTKVVDEDIARVAASIMFSPEANTFLQSINNNKTM